MEQTDLHFMSIAQNIAKESHCLRRRVGAVLVTQDGGKIVTAVNNPVPDKHFCEREGCLREKRRIDSGTQAEVCHCVHSETSLIVQCALNGISPKGASVYTTLFPCSMCARILCIAGINRIFFCENYPASDAKDIFTQFGVEVVQLAL